MQRIIEQLARIVYELSAKKLGGKAAREMVRELALKWPEDKLLIGIPAEIATAALQMLLTLKTVNGETKMTKFGVEHRIVCEGCGAKMWTFASSPHFNCDDCRNPRHVQFCSARNDDEKASDRLYHGGRRVDPNLREHVQEKYDSQMEPTAVRESGF